MQFLKRMIFYMDGRYGMDELSRMLMIIGLSLSLLSSFVGGGAISLIGVGFLAFGALRPLSKEVGNRQRESEWYISKKQRILSFYWKLRNKQIQRKTYKMYKCTECKQKIRVPKGKKKIRITCPSCQHQFIKKT